MKIKKKSIDTDGWKKSFRVKTNAIIVEQESYIRHACECFNEQHTNTNLIMF